MGRKSAPRFLAAVALVILLAVPGVGYAKAGGAGVKCQQNGSTSPAAQSACASRDTPSGVLPRSHSVLEEIDVTAVEAWMIVAVVTLVAMFVGMYPIVYYITQVWRSRQKAIFETLSIKGKAEYLSLYRSSEVVGLVTDKDIDAAFSMAYNHWFGRGRLVSPAWLIGFILFGYIFLASTYAAHALLPTWLPPFQLQLVALAAMTGAYILVTMDTIARVVRRDLLPEDLQLTALRLIACVPLGYAFASIVEPSAAPFVALALTSIPLQQLAGFLGQLAGKRLGADLPAAAAVPTQDAPSQLSGVDRAVCERLSAIGVNTITQIAYSDPVQLTMRTSLGFVFVLDVVSQALAWVYVESKLNSLRLIGLRGSFEIAALKQEFEKGDPHAAAVISQLPAMLGISDDQCRNLLHQLADDAYVQFLLIAYA